MAPEQYTIGHTLVILKRHRTALTDNTLTKEELTGFISVCREVAQHLKEILKDENGKSPQQIYICFLCDGVEHLHAHLIPRYRFTPEDEVVYKHKFIKRDGKEEIEKNIQKGELEGFWYVAERERTYKKFPPWQKSDKERADWFEYKAKELRMTIF